MNIDMHRWYAGVYDDDGNLFAVIGIGDSGELCRYGSVEEFEEDC